LLGLAAAAKEQERMHESKITSGRLESQWPRESGFAPRTYGRRTPRVK